MAIALSLVERTMHRLRYLAVADGGAGAAPDVTAITNRLTGGVAGADLNVDAFVDSALGNLLRSTVADTAAARRIFGDTLTAVGDQAIPRAHLKIRPRNSWAVVLATASIWSADAVEGGTVDPASAGRTAIVINGPNVANAACYIDIEFQHTITL